MRSGEFSADRIQQSSTGSSGLSNAQTTAARLRDLKSRGNPPANEGRIRRHHARGHRRRLDSKGDRLEPPACLLLNTALAWHTALLCRLIDYGGKLDNRVKRILERDDATRRGSARVRPQRSAPGLSRGDDG